MTKKEEKKIRRSTRKFQEEREIRLDELKKIENQKESLETQVLKKAIIRHLEGQTFDNLEFVYYYLRAGERAATQH